MSLHPKSVFHDAYYKHVLNKRKTKGDLGKVFDLITNISDRRGLKQAWEEIDAVTQDDIIMEWIDIIE